ncbi:MAG: fasciclin domain-containing protein [Gemmobacter sp.]|nr:fasciclin domain-containing protein [Gemmobacter sp.]
MHKTFALAALTLTLTLPGLAANPMVGGAPMYADKTIVENALYVVDESRGASEITIRDVNQSNGVIHVVNKVLLPK